LLATSQFASWRSCDQPTRSRFSVVFLGPRANAELVPKFHVALHASHGALPMVTLQISPYTNWLWLLTGSPCLSWYHTLWTLFGRLNYFSLIILTPHPILNFGIRTKTLACPLKYIIFAA
jgi:hypothetical protein